jgi:hypothetical protein
VTWQIGDRVQTVTRRGHFAKGTVTEVDEIGINGEPYYYVDVDGPGPLKRWEPASNLIAETDELCYCHSCCYCFSRKRA